MQTYSESVVDREQEPEQKQKPLLRCQRVLFSLKREKKKKKMSAGSEKIKAPQDRLLVGSHEKTTRRELKKHGGVAGQAGNLSAAFRQPYGQEHPPNRSKKNARSMQGLARLDPSG